MLGFRKNRFRFLVVVALFCVNFLPAAGVFAQTSKTPQVKSQEYSEEDGIPVLTKHLPDFKNVVNSATYVLNADDLRKTLGDRPILTSVDFTGGTEAVTAKYSSGTLLIVEFTTPQFSVEADSKIRQTLADTIQNPPVHYRRIGNYSAFVFDSTDEISANLLLDQVVYEKEVRWLGEDPFALHRAERAFVLQTSDLFVNITLAIVGGLGISVVIGIIAGFVYYQFRVRQRANFGTFTDAGGMTRLNLDGFTPEIPIERLLGK